MDSTYTKEGHYDVVWYCEDCGRELARETYPIDVIAHEHDYQEIYRVDANCSELGTVYYQCKLCGATTEDSIPKNDVHADVNNDGICDRCGKQPMVGPGRCPQCGRIHNAGFFDRITGVFHRISYFFSHLFTR